MLPEGTSVSAVAGSFATALALFLCSTFSTAARIPGDTRRICSPQPGVLVRIDDVPAASRDSTLTLDIEILSIDSLLARSIGGFRLAVQFDPQELSLQGVDNNGLDDECGWFWGFVLSPQVIDNEPKMTLLMVGEDTSSNVACFSGAVRAVTLLFRAVRDCGEARARTSVDFYWRTCDDNTLWLGDHDTTLLAIRVVDAQGVAITDPSDSLPGFTGPDSSCFDPVAFGGSPFLRTIDFESGYIEFRATTDVIETSNDSRSRHTVVRLHQNYPNPFNSATIIEFELAIPSVWSLSIANIQGRVLRSFQGVSSNNRIRIRWDGNDRQGRPAASGVYLCVLSVGNQRLTRKMLLAR